MSDDTQPDIEVSFADVAAEDPEQSVSAQPDSLDHDAAAAEAESRNDTAPDGPTISSIMGGGPVGEGDELAP